MAVSQRDRLQRELSECHRQAERLDSPGFPRAALSSLQHFQRQRLATSYADLAAQERYAAAIDFFLAELYGGRSVRERDQQVQQVLPVMRRMLPPRLQGVLADAFRLQAMSLRLDIALAEVLQDRGAIPVDLAGYSEFYATVPQAQREEQIALIEGLAFALDRSVRKPLVLTLMSAMRKPARAAGFGALQQFLERGLRAFRAMGGADEFAAIIVRRETRAMRRLYAQHPRPFDP